MSKSNADHIDDGTGTDNHPVEDPDSPASGTPAEHPALDPERLNHLDATDRQRYLQKPKKHRPRSDEVAGRIRDSIVFSMGTKQYCVIQAPTGSNKTGTAVETKWRDNPFFTGGQPVVLLCETIEQRDEAIERGETAGLDICALDGSHDLCDMARGDYDDTLRIQGTPPSEWFEEQTRAGGVPFGYAHKKAEKSLEHKGIDPPCGEGDSECPAKAQWPDGGFFDDGGEPRFDLIITTDQFAFVPSLREQANIIHDEQPDYSEDLGLDSPSPPELTARVREMINLLLERANKGPDTWEELIQQGRESAQEYAFECDELDVDDRAADWITDIWHNQRVAEVNEFFDEPNLDWYMKTPGAHTLAPAIIKCVWKALHGGEPSGGIDPDTRGKGVFDRNGRAKATVRHQTLRPEVPSNNDKNESLVTVVIDDKNSIRTIRNIPDFSIARSVVGLDAFPTPEVWQLNVHRDMTVERTLDYAEEQLFRRFEQGKTVVELGTADRSAGIRGRHWNEDHASALIRKLRETYDDDFRTVGGPSGFEDDLARLIFEAGGDPDGVETLHYNEEKSRNPEEFATTPVGLVYGCIDPGDDYVLDLLAELGLDAVPERSDTPCEHCDGDGCHECGGTGRRREHGRGFTGPNRDAAMRILESVRAMQVAQMVGRYGRDLDVKNGERNITYVSTAVLSQDPRTQHLVDYRTEGVVHTETELERQVVEYVIENSWSTTRKIADAVDCSKKHAIDVLDDIDWISRRRGTGPYGADEWAVHSDVNSSLDRVDLGEEIVTSPVYSTNTWEVTIEQVAPLVPDDRLDSREDAVLEDPLTDSDSST
jgi:hypothetical protein